MAESDWTYLNDGLDAATVLRGRTTGIPKPPGGGDFVYAFNSTTVAAGAVALFANQEDFAPMAFGGSMRGCIQRGPGGGPMGFSPFLFLCGQGVSVNDGGYLLGLSDEDPHRIVLRKGSVVLGTPLSEGPGALMRSSESYIQGTWLHLRLDALVQANGDVLLHVFASDLDAHTVGSPQWEPVGGMETFVDDTTGINSGSVPYTSGRAGYGFASQDTTRRGYFDHIEVIRHEML